MGSTAHFEPFAVSASGTYYVTLDPGAGAIVSADLSVVPR
jgi:hypothetical protein